MVLKKKQDYLVREVGDYSILCLKYFNEDAVNLCLEAYASTNRIPLDEVEFRGRGRPIKLSLPLLGSESRISAIMRRNYRGGIYSHLVKDRYFCIFEYPEKSRPFMEFKCLKDLRAFGIPVPEPLFAIVKRSWGVFYSGALVTKELNSKGTLLDIVNEVSFDKLREYSFSAGLWAGRALEHLYLHTDLHLGNVLIGDLGINLIDFDKFKICKNFIRGSEFLIDRWNRGAKKRAFDEKRVRVLETSFLAGLRYGKVL